MRFLRPTICRLLIAALLVGVRPCKAQRIKAQEAVQILESQKFRISKKVSDIPRDVLEKAGVLGSREKLEKLITDRWSLFNGGDALEAGDITKMLIFCDISKRYLALGYLRGGYAEGYVLLLIDGINGTPRVVFHAELFGEDKSIEDVKSRLRKGEFQSEDSFSL